MNASDFGKGLGHDVQHKISKKGLMNDAEEDLFKYINMVLQYPPCFHHTMRIFSANKKRMYPYAIARYVSHMANKGFTKNSFVINGLFMVECMEEYIEDEHEKNGLDLLNGGGSMDCFVNALKSLLNCVGIYKTKDIANPRERKEALLKDWSEIPHVVQMVQYAKDRRKATRALRRNDFHDMTRPDTYHEKITLDQMKQMMVNMYELTGVPDERGAWSKTNIYNGINATLELMLGHNCLLRSLNKVALELSDSLYHNEETKNGIIPVLGLSLDLGKTHKDTPPLIGACRHKHVELCLVSAFAMSLWYRFDFGDKYAPNASDCNAGFFLSKEKWYSVKVLFDDAQAPRNNNSISCTYEAKLVVMALESIEQTNTRRYPGTQLADAYGILESQIKRAGFCSNEVIDESYLCYPFDFMHCVAGFLEDEKYYLPRQIEPPEELQREIFPWLEEVTSAIHNRTDHEGSAMPQSDHTVVRFVKILKDFRSVILQDLAVMLEKAPNSVFSRHEITKHPLFIKFKAGVHARIKRSSVLDITNDQKDVARALAPVFVSQVEGLRAGLERSFFQVNEKQNVQTMEIANLQALVQGFIRSIPERDEANREFVKATIEDAMQVYGEKSFGGSIEDFRIEMREKFAHLEEVYMRQPVSRDISPSSNRRMVSRIPASPTASSLPSTSARVRVVSTASPVVNQEEIFHRRRKPEHIPDFARNHPELQMSFSTTTVPDLLEEWYVEKECIPSVEKRNHLYKAQWRGNPSLYKRRRALIKFINDELRTNDNLRGATRDDLGVLLEQYRKQHHQHLNALCTVLQGNGKFHVSEDLVSMWLAQKNRLNAFS